VTTTCSIVPALAEVVEVSGAVCADAEATRHRSPKTCKLKDREINLRFGMNNDSSLLL